MAETVWCVFQKLPDDRCPSLSAVCRSHDVAERVVRLSEEDERMQGVQELSQWTIREWNVLDAEVDEMRDIQQISHVLDPQREGVLEPADPEVEPEGADA